VVDDDAAADVVGRLFFDLDVVLNEDDDVEE